MKTVIVLILAAGLFTLVRRRLIHIDISFFLFLALIVLALASFSDTFIEVAATFFGISYSPIVIILLALFILLCLVTLLAVYVTRMRQRHASLVRRLAVLEGALEEKRLKDTPSSESTQIPPAN